MLIPYNSDKYLDRFDESKRWVKILPLSNRKPQIAETIELQSILQYQIKSNFSYLYGYYAITRGLKLSLQKLSSDTSPHLYLLTGGQVYIQTQTSSFYIDIDSETLEIDIEGRTSIGLIISYWEEANLKDPITGDELFGTEGSNRLLVKYEIVKNEDSYPIATVTNTSTIPDIYYFKNNEFSQTYRKSTVSKKIEKNIAKRWREEIGNFISSGLNLCIKDNIITIEPGVAYINGHRICLPYKENIQLNITSQKKKYLICLSRNGEILFFESGDLIYSLSSPNDAVCLGEVISQKINNVYISEIKPSLSRILTVADILNLQNAQEEVSRDILDIVIKNNILNLSYRSEVGLTGLLLNAFNSFKGSDTNSLLYSASIIPSLQAIRTSFISKTKKVDNLTIASSNNISIGLKNNKAYYLTPDYTEEKLIEQNVATGWMNLNVNLNRIACMNISPNIGYVDSTDISSNYKATLVHPSILSNLKDSILNSLKSNYSKFNYDISLNLKGEEIIVDCKGFGKFADNLKLTFGTRVISQFTLLNGTLNGSTLGTIKAKEDGTVKVAFVIPSLPLQNYVVSLSNNISTATALFTGVNDIQKRADIDLDIVNTNNEITNTSQVLKGLGQTFYIDSSITLSSIDLKFRSIPDSTFSSEFLTVNIVSTSLGIPNSTSLGVGVLNLNETLTTSNGSRWSKVKFEKPIFLQRGMYAFVISSFLEGGEIFYAEVGKGNLETGDISSSQNLVLGNMLLHINDRWEPQLSKDLCFKLNKAVSKSLQSEIVYQIKDVETFNTVEFEIPYVEVEDTRVEIFSKEDNSTWKLVNKNRFSLSTSSSQTEIKIRLNAGANILPVVDINNAIFKTFKNNKKGSWISTTIEQDEAYTEVDVTFDCYQPKGTKISPKFTSTNGQTWENLEEIEAHIINENIPLYRVRYKKSNLSETVVISKENVMRKKMTLRIDFETEDESVQPFVTLVKGASFK